MSRKVETIGCETPLKDVPDADAAGFAALLKNLVSEEFDADGSLAIFNFPLDLFGGEAVLAILGAEASTELELFCVTALAKLLVNDALAFWCMRASKSLATSAG